MLDFPKHSLIVWRLLDGKPGHESQTLGLVRALDRQLVAAGSAPVRCLDMPLGHYRYTLLDWFFRRFRPGFLQPRPDLVIGAGHRTHWPMLCARHAFGGRAIALMTPSLPRRWFDRVVAPAHDDVRGANVIVTRGVLNAMQPAAAKRPGYTLVLVGGISKHFPWHSSEVLAQIEAIMARHPQVRLTDSRRTPPELRAELALRWPVVYQPWEQCPPGWLAAELGVAENAWVSEDSVSMVYESLTAGCAVGLITLAEPGSVSGRLANGVATLARDGLVRRLADLRPGDTLHVAEPLLNEAERVAAAILEDFSGEGVA